MVEVSREDNLIMALQNGMMFMGDWETIHALVKGRKVKVELGTANGLTSILISRGGTVSDDASWNGKGETYTIDKGNGQTMKAYLARFGIDAIKGDTVEAASEFDNESVDFLFIDAGHCYEEVKADYEAWYPNVKRGGVIVFHDYNVVHDGVVRFVDELTARTGSPLVELPPLTAHETCCKAFTKCE